MLVLASGSPRRREILSMCGFDFTVSPAHGDEAAYSGGSFALYAEGLASDKAEEIFTLGGGRDTVIGADTIVVMDGEVLGKPADRDDARRMLRLLSGRTHTVYTGVCVRSPERVNTFHSSTLVTFYELTDEQIDSYVLGGEPMDKAGAYGIQGRGSTLIKSICGDYYTVVGLPAALTVRVLGRFGAVPAA